ncbi:MAG: hypothetical protein IPG93_26085 [Burkholderiales bacterium]|nr:hypothetical protein [Burkholderiales bacterium]
MNKSNSLLSLASIASAINCLTPGERFASAVANIFCLTPKPYFSWTNYNAHDVIADVVESADLEVISFVTTAAANLNGEGFLESIENYIELRSMIERFCQTCAMNFILQSDRRLYASDIDVPKVVSWVHDQVTKSPRMSELTKVRPSVFQDICLETARHLEQLVYSRPRD